MNREEVLAVYDELVQTAGDCEPQVGCITCEVRAQVRTHIASALGDAERFAWQPIETAPRDGIAYLLGWNDGNHIPCVGYWSGRHRMWIVDRYRSWGGLRAMREEQPTHWMELPEDPK